MEKNPIFFTPQAVKYAQIIADNNILQTVFEGEETGLSEEALLGGINLLIEDDEGELIPGSRDQARAVDWLFSRGYLQVRQERKPPYTRTYSLWEHK